LGDDGGDYHNAAKRPSSTRGHFDVSNNIEFGAAGDDQAGHAEEKLYATEDHIEFGATGADPRPP